MPLQSKTQNKFADQMHRLADINEKGETIINNYVENDLSLLISKELG